MQEKVILPENGWSKFNRVKDGYGINRFFGQDQTTSSLMVYLPSRTEVNEFIREYDGTDFTEKELRNFLTSDLMNGSFFDTQLREIPSPSELFIGESKADVFTPADLIDSWLRAPEQYTADKVTETTFEMTTKGTFRHTADHSFMDSKGIRDKNLPLFNCIKSERVNFANEFFPSGNKFSIAAMSVLNRRRSMNSAVLPLLDMHRVPLSVLEDIFYAEDGGGCAPFDVLGDRWIDDSQKFIDSLTILKVEGGVLKNPERVEWLFLMATHDVDLDIAVDAIERHIVPDQLAPYIVRGIDHHDALNFIEFDIDPSLSESLYEVAS